MLQVLGVIALGAAVAYLLDDAKSSNSSARRRYKKTKEKSVKKVKKYYYHAQKKEKLDKLFKIKRAKREIADAIYKDIQNTKKNTKKVNKFLKESKEMLNNLFEKKRKERDYNKKSEIQKEINTVIKARRELFKIREMIKENIKILYENLKLANMQTREIQEEINRVLSR